MSIGGSEQRKRSERRLAAELALSAAHKSIPVIAIASAVNALALAAFARYFGDHWSVFVWAALVACVSAYGLKVYRSKRLIAVNDHEKTARRFMIRSLISGAIWGALVADAIIGAGEPAVQHIALSVAIGVTASAAIAYLRMPPAAFAFVAPLFILAFGAYAMVQTKAFAFVSPITLCYGVFLAFVLRAGYESFREHVHALLASSEHVAAFKRADRDREAIMATLSHEMRTPLHQILGFAEILRRGAEDQGRGSDAEYAAFIEDAARRLNTHLGRVVEAKRLSDALADLSPERVDLCDLLNRAQYDLASVVQPRRQRIVVTAPQSGGDFVSDREAIRTIALNIIENASKFSPADSSIHVVGLLEGDMASIIVMDDGQGMTEEEAEKAFDPFFRGMAARDSQDSGLGVGLFVVRLLCERLGGDARMTSAPGAGALIHVRLPARLGDAPLTPPV